MPNRKAIVIVAASITAASGGAGFTAYWEGKVNTVYLDPLKIPTGCYGRTGKDDWGHQIELGRTYTDEQCLQMLSNDVNPCWKAADRFVLVPMAGYQQYSLTDFCVNAGQGALKNSPMVKFANRGDWISGCNAFIDYYVTGRDRKLGMSVRLPGLERRRTAEAALCRGEDVVLK